MSGSHTAPGGASHGSTKTYITGLILSIVLTVIPFGMVMSGGFSTSATLITILIMAVLQVLVQLIMFMHLDSKSEGGWNLISIVFALTILVLIVGGSIWIMHNLMINTM
ncbi:MULTISPECIES: cytochrome o ubiquinol oxidase subunit IV [unclassified Modicisalibacter]|uniref:cytochrome o ubiquinol oxidase subunit IV n=1 Tax=unclassified Modicisalibacter TaxID=2679913 RepID=UPI001CCBF551|nr:MULTISPECIES: cytochrome o ubiquinol oxidase subunit IV [unclassified Modicisalibacter]MBZ9557690.1 cytochrome o ubiquinol oxidase subunit IV [Modicisalibacter sp. R2A 31.J]MBZ9573646.1 cytochrome o ubiquinol oxidase subunit IV [Modicisalibacter sp. MOD 31.J]